MVIAMLAMEVVPISLAMFLGGGRKPTTYGVKYSQGRSGDDLC